MRRLTLEMRIANPLWGAPRIHGQLLTLGIERGQTMLAKYLEEDLLHIMPMPSRRWTRPRISFRLLYERLVLRPSRLLWLGVTARPSA